MSSNSNDRVAAIYDIVDQLTKAMKHVLDTKTKTCLNCLHFDEPNEQCSRFGNQRPPARIIATGCTGHEDEIPF